MATCPARDFGALKSKIKRTEWGTGRVAQIITSSSYPVTVRDFTLLIMGCKKQCEWLKALEIFDVLRRVGAGELKLLGRAAEHAPAPNFYSYSAVVSVCCKTGALPAALSLLCLMKQEAQKDESLAPDETTYRQLITAAKRWRNMELVLVLFEEAKLRGLEVDQHCLRCCLEASMGLGRWSQALDIVDKLVHCGSEEGLSGEELQSQFLDIVRGCGDSGEMNLIVEVLLTMQVLGLEPGVEVLTAVMLAAERAEDVKFGMELYQELCDKACEVPRQALDSFVRLLEKSGNWEYAVFVAGRTQEMMSKELQ